MQNEKLRAYLSEEADMRVFLYEALPLRSENCYKSQFLKNIAIIGK